jgi:Na+-transporting NADH:ubiquinone oxidoreductase subunit C
MPPHDGSQRSWHEFLRETTLGTFLVACSVMVSSAAVGLKGFQDRNRELDKKKNVLFAAGLCEPGVSGDEVERLFAENIQEVVIDLATGEPVASEGFDSKRYDPRKASKDPKAHKAVIPAGAMPGISFREPYASVYKIVEGEAVRGYVFPVYGKGLWSTLYGFISIEADKSTVRGITFYKHAETPGLGGEVDNANWKKLWHGKKAYGDDGKVALGVIKGRAPAEDIHAIDGLSGATITSNGVDDMVKYWLGPEGFGKYLAQN